MANIIQDQKGEYRTSAGHRLSAEDILSTAANILEAKAIRGSIWDLTSPDLTKQYLRCKYRTRENEVFGAIMLDNRHRVIKTEELSTGTIDGAAVYPREVIKTVLKHNAAAVVFFHNHPSGFAEPSPADRNITERLIDALRAIDVRVLDHMVIGDKIVSFSERGWL